MNPKNTVSRRDFLRLAALTTGSFALAACAAPSTAPAAQPAGATQSAATQPTAAAAPKTAPVKIVHWQHHAASRAKVVEQFKARFEDENKNVTIDFQSIPWADYWSKLASAVAAGKGSAPDVFQIPMGLVEEYVDSGNLVPVPQEMTGSLKDAYLPWTTQRAKRGNDLYGLPLDVQTLLIYRNDELYQQAGLDPKKPFADLNDLYDQAKKLTKKSGGNTDQIGCDTSYYSAWQTVLYQQIMQREKGGKPTVDPTTNKLVYNDVPEMFEAFKWFCKLSADTDDDSFLKGQNRFVLGKAGMALNHPVSRGDLKVQAPNLKFTIVPFPVRSTGQQPYTGGSHWLWVVGKWVSDAPTAWKWVSYGTNKAAQLTWTDVGGDLPSIKELVDDPRFRSNENDAACIDSLKYASPWEWVGWAEWVKEYGDARDRVVVGNEDSKKSFTTMVDNLNKVIAQHTPKK